MVLGVSAASVALYVAVGLLALFLTGWNPRWLPVLLILVMPCGDFDIEGPLTLSLSKLVLIVFLLTLPAQLFVARTVGRGIRIPASVWAYLTSISVITLLAYVWAPATSAEGFDLLRNPSFRPLVQLASLFLRVTGLVAVLLWASDRASWVRLCKAALFATTLVAAYGVYQFAGYYLGLPIMGIHRAQADTNGQLALFRLGSLGIFRVGSFVGEPKDAARYLLPSIVLIVFARSTAIARLRSWVTSIPVLVLHLVIFVLTFSTSSFFAALISLPFLSALLQRCRVRLHRVAIAAGAMSVALAATVAIARGPATALDIYNARITSRIGEVDDADRAAITFLREKPEYLFAGVGLGNASFVLRPYFDPTDYGHLTVTLNSGFLQVLLEGGIFALLLFLLFLGGWIVRGARILRTDQLGEHRAMLATTLAVCTVLLAINCFDPAEAQMWVYWGLLMTVCRARGRELHPGAAVAGSLLRSDSSSLGGAPSPDPRIPRHRILEQR